MAGKFKAALPMQRAELNICKSASYTSNRVSQPTEYRVDYAKQQHDKLMGQLFLNVYINCLLQFLQILFKNVEYLLRSNIIVLVSKCNPKVKVKTRHFE